MIGPPKSGKSFYVEQHQHELTKDPVVITSPDSVGLYDPSVFVQFSKAIREQRDIIIDLTNLTESSRARFFYQLPDEYDATAVIMAVDIDVLFDRLRKARGDEDNLHTVRKVKQMMKLYQAPSFEDFDRILHVL
jgi:hypothetical protein